MFTVKAWGKLQVVALKVWECLESDILMMGYRAPKALVHRTNSFLEKTHYKQQKAVSMLVYYAQGLEGCYNISSSVHFQQTILQQLWLINQ